MSKHPKTYPKISHNHFVELEWKPKIGQPWLPPLISNAPHTSWVGASFGASWGAIPSADTCSCQKWKHLSWMYYNEIHGPAIKQFTRLYQNNYVIINIILHIKSYYTWMWVGNGCGSCGPLHAMGTLEILLKNVYKMVVGIQGAYKMDPAGTERNNHVDSQIPQAFQPWTGRGNQ